MTSGRAIDHVVLAVHDLDRAAQVYEGLGFTLTPRAQHEDRMGTSNRLAQLANRTFVELLEVDRPQGVMSHGEGVFSFGAWNRDRLAEAEGISMIVFATDDARADIAAWRAAGIATYEPFDFDRQATLPDGGTATVSFSLGFATSLALPNLAVFVCENCAPQHFWKPAFQTHANGAQGIAAVVVPAPDPEPAADFLAQLFGGETAPIADGIAVACGAAGAIHVVTPEAARARDGAAIDARPGLVIQTSTGPQPTIPAALAAGAHIEWTA